MRRGAGVDGARRFDTGGVGVQKRSVFLSALLHVIGALFFEVSWAFAERARVVRVFDREGDAKDGGVFVALLHLGIVPAVDSKVRDFVGRDEDLVVFVSGAVDRDD